MFRRRFSTRRLGRRRKGLTINHYEDDTSLDTVPTATETTATVAVGIDDATNRSTHIPDGSWLKSIRVAVEATAIPSTATKFQAILWRRPGGDATTSPISNYFATTDPATASMMAVRRYKLHGPVTKFKAANDFTASRIYLRWRGNLKIRDGDDILVTVLQNSGGNLDFNVRTTLAFRT